MGVVKFSALTLLGSGVWNGVLIWLGVLLGENWTVVSDTMDRHSTVVYMLLVLAVVACVFYLVRRDRKRKQKVANGGG